MLGDRYRQTEAASAAIVNGWSSKAVSRMRCGTIRRSGYNPSFRQLLACDVKVAAKKGDR